MKIIKTSLKHLLNNKHRLIFFITGFSAIASLFIYAMFSVDINKNLKFKEISDLPKNIAIIDKSVYSNISIDKIEETNQIEYTTRNLISSSQGVMLDVISPGLLDIGFPVYHNAMSSYFNIDNIELLYIENNLELSNIEYPIIIDDITSIKLFQRKNSIGEKITIFIDDNEILFQVYAVIKETRERLDLLQYTKGNDLPDEINEDAVGYSHAYMFEETYVNITESKPNYSLIVIKSDTNLNLEKTKNLLEYIDTSSYEYPYYPGLNIYELYETRFNLEFKNSMLSNLVLLGIISVVFILILINGIIYNLKESNYDIANLKILGVNKNSIFRWFIYHWLIQLIISFIIGFIITITILSIKYNVVFYQNINIYFKYLLITIFSNTVLVLILAIPITYIFIRKNQFITNFLVER